MKREWKNYKFGNPGIEKIYNYSLLMKSINDFMTDD